MKRSAGDVLEEELDYGDRGEEYELMSFSEAVAIATRIDSLAAGAPKEIRVGLWFETPHVESTAISIGAEDCFESLEQVSSVAYRARRQQSSDQSSLGRMLLASELIAAGETLGSCDKLIGHLRELEHGSAIRTMDYRGCGVWHAEKIFQDFLLHPRENEYGYAPPLFFFDQYDPEEELTEYAEKTYFPEFLSDEAFAAFQAEMGDVEIPREKGTVVSFGEDADTEVSEIRQGEVHFMIAYARLWLSRVGRKERARRVARVVLHSLFRDVLPQLVCDVIAAFVVHEQ
jgi:hypothetical protein